MNSIRRQAMTDTRTADGLVVGSELAGPVRVTTMERIHWYEGGMRSAATGVRTLPHSNIHTDAEYARSQGLSAPIADGMMSTNWISSMLVHYFGMEYVAHGELRTKFIKPIFLGAVVATRGRVTSVERAGSGGTVYGMEVWCEDEKGVKLTVGDAKAEVAPRP
jgi:3-hydroxybutyryl-CoA dehydratase